MPSAAAWVDPEGVVPSGVSQAEEYTSHVWSPENRRNKRTNDRADLAGAEHCDGAKRGAGCVEGEGEESRGAGRGMRNVVVSGGTWVSRGGCFVSNKTKLI